MMRKRIVAAAVCLFLLCQPIALSAEQSLRRGDSGTKVRQLQTKLKNWGYYDGAVDGIFGSGTEKAVISFQRKNGLTQDGVVGTQTANALGLVLSTSGSSGSSSGTSASGDLNLLARVVHGEARGESYTGKVAVAAVVLNRVESAKFPNSIAGVVYQKNAFTCVADGQINLAPDSVSYQAAKDAMNGWDPSGGALYYYNPAKATSNWIYSRTVIAVIGKHRFAI